MTKIAALTLFILSAAVVAEAQGRSWAIQLEEPTGIERRDKEVVRLATRFAAGEARAGQLRVLDDESRELPLQAVVGDTHPDGSIKSAEILFPATLIPGRLPRYRLLALPSARMISTTSPAAIFFITIRKRTMARWTSLNWTLRSNGLASAPDSSTPQGNSAQPSRRQQESQRSSGPK